MPPKQPRAPRHTWLPDHRHVLHMLFQEYNLGAGGQSAEAHSIFTRVFQGATLTSKRIYDEWAGRKLKGRNPEKWTDTIDKPLASYSAAEQAVRATYRVQILQAANALGITLTPQPQYLALHNAALATMAGVQGPVQPAISPQPVPPQPVPVSITNSTVTIVQQPPSTQPVQPSGGQQQSSSTSNGFESTPPPPQPQQTQVPTAIQLSPGARTYPTIAHTGQEQDANGLYMIHRSDMITNITAAGARIAGLPRFTASQALKFGPEHISYAQGGLVVRALLLRDAATNSPQRVEDVMVCNAECPTCAAKGIRPVRAGNGSTVTNGLPFAHFLACNNNGPQDLTFASQLSTPVPAVDHGGGLSRYIVTYYKGSRAVRAISSVCQPLSCARCDPTIRIRSSAYDYSNLDDEQHNVTLGLSSDSSPLVPTAFTQPSDIEDTSASHNVGEPGSWLRMVHRSKVIENTAFQTSAGVAGPSYWTGYQRDSFGAGEDVYRYGGPVITIQWRQDSDLSVFDFGGDDYEDVMLCRASRCQVCTPLALPPAYSVNGSSEDTGGRPFLHARQASVEDGQLRCDGTIPRPVQNVAHWGYSVEQVRYQPDNAFSLTVETAVCIQEQCRTCSPSTAGKRPGDPLESDQSKRQNTGCGPNHSTSPSSAGGTQQPTSSDGGSNPVRSQTPSGRTSSSPRPQSETPDPEVTEQKLRMVHRRYLELNNDQAGNAIAGQPMYWTTERRISSFGLVYDRGGPVRNVAIRDAAGQYAGDCHLMICNFDFCQTCNWRNIVAGRGTAFRGLPCVHSGQLDQPLIGPDFGPVLGDNEVVTAASDPAFDRNIVFSDRGRRIVARTSVCAVDTCNHCQQLMTGTEESSVDPPATETPTAVPPGTDTTTAVPPSTTAPIRATNVQYPLPPRGDLPMVHFSRLSPTSTPPVAGQPLYTAPFDALFDDALVDSTYAGGGPVINIFVSGDAILGRPDGDYHVMVCDIAKCRLCPGATGAAFAVNDALHVNLPSHDGLPYVHSLEGSGTPRERMFMPPRNRAVSEMFLWNRPSGPTFDMIYFQGRTPMVQRTRRCEQGACPVCSPGLYSQLFLVHRVKLRRTPPGWKVRYRCDLRDLRSSRDPEWHHGGPVMKVRVSDSHTFLDAMVCQYRTCAVCLDSGAAWLAHTHYRQPFVHIRHCTATAGNGNLVFNGVAPTVNLDRGNTVEVERRMVQYRQRGPNRILPPVMSAVCVLATCSICQEVEQGIRIREEEDNVATIEPPTGPTSSATHTSQFVPIVAPQSPTTDPTQQSTGPGQAQEGMSNTPVDTTENSAAGDTQTTPSSGIPSSGDTSTQPPPPPPPQSAPLRMCHYRHLNIVPTGVNWGYKSKEGGGTVDGYFVPDDFLSHKWGGPVYTVDFPDATQRNVMSCIYKRCPKCTRKKEDNTDQSGTVPSFPKPFAHRKELTPNAGGSGFRFTMRLPTSLDQASRYNVALNTVTVTFPRGGGGGTSAVTSPCFTCTSGNCNVCDDDAPDIGVAAGDEEGGEEDPVQDHGEGGDDEGGQGHEGDEENADDGGEGQQADSDDGHQADNGEAQQEDHPDQSEEEDLYGATPPPPQRTTRQTRSMSRPVESEHTDSEENSEVEEDPEEEEESEESDYEEPQTGGRRTRRVYVATS